MDAWKKNGRRRSVVDALSKIGGGRPGRRMVVEDRWYGPGRRMVVKDWWWMPWKKNGRRRLVVFALEEEWSSKMGGGCRGRRMVVEVGSWKKNGRQRWAEDAVEEEWSKPWKKKIGGGCPGRRMAAEDWWCRRRLVADALEEEWSSKIGGCPGRRMVLEDWWWMPWKKNGRQRLVVDALEEEWSSKIGGGCPGSRMVKDGRWMRWKKNGCEDWWWMHVGLTVCLKIRSQQGTGFSNIEVDEAAPIQIAGFDIAEAFYAMELPSEFRDLFGLRPVRASQVELTHVTGPANMFIVCFRAVLVGWAQVLWVCQHCRRC